MRTACTISMAMIMASTLAQEYHEVRQLDIRPLGEDYAAVPYPGGFVMSSSREGSSAIDYRDAATGGYLSDLYFVAFDGEVAGVPKPFGDVLNTRLNEGPADFADGGKTICYTRNIDADVSRKGGRQRPSQLGLFFSTQEGDRWTTPVAFEHNTERYALMHPTFSPMADSLVFASDMPGGFGGFDLYFSVRKGTGWSIPENLGPMVNSAYNEVYPRWSPSGELFLATDRPGGFGGLDIQVTRNGPGGWSTPEALPEPVNSSANDHGFARIPGTRTALYTSDRNGRDAIHLARTMIPKFVSCLEQVEDNHCFLFSKPAHPITEKVALDHVWDMGDGHRITGNEARHCFDAPGTYHVRSMLVESSSGDVFHVLQEHRMELTSTVQAYILAPDTVRTGGIVVLDATQSHLPGVVAEQYHWDLGDGSEASGDRAMHQYVKEGTYTIRLDIHGEGVDQPGLRDHCRTKNIVVIDGYRKNDDGTLAIVSRNGQGNTRSFEYQEIPHDPFQITLEEQEDVRFSVTLFARKERIGLDDPVFMEVSKSYRVMEHYDPMKAVYVYTVGDTEELEEAYEIYKALRALEFMEADVFVLQEDKPLDMSRLDMASRQDLDRAKVSTSAIHFAFNSAEIMDDARQELEPIIRIMKKHPEMHLVVEAHTDDIGSKGFNMELSQQRAMAVVQALEVRGIASERLTPVGHGKNKPVASNQTEAGRQANRRVEFRMVMSDELQAIGGVR